MIWTVWTCFGGEDESEESVEPEIGMLDKIDIAVEEKFSKIKKAFKDKFSARRQKRSDWKAKKTIMA